MAEKNIDGICEVLLSFRVNALQIAPELRKNLVYELIRNDLFKIEELESLQFLLDLVDNPNPKLRYSLLPLISIICSTLRGVEYITSRKDLSVVRRVIKVIFVKIVDSQKGRQWNSYSTVLFGFTTKMLSQRKCSAGVCGGGINQLANESD